MEESALLRVHVWVNKFKRYLLSLGRFVVNVLIYVVRAARAVATALGAVTLAPFQPLLELMWLAGARWSRARPCRR